MSRRCRFFLLAAGLCGAVGLLGAPGCTVVLAYHKHDWRGAAVTPDTLNQAAHSDGSIQTTEKPLTTQSEARRLDLDDEYKAYFGKEAP